MQEYFHYSIPLIAALIGWITNLIAVKMLFHPRQEIRFLGLRIQGVFPKRQQAFAQKLGAIVSSELLSIGEVSSFLRSKASSPNMRAYIVQKIERTLTERIPQVLPMAAMFLGASQIQGIVQSFHPDLDSLIDELIHKVSAELESEFDVHAIVESKVASFSSDKLEEIIYAIMRKELVFVELIGGVLGFIIGLVQLLIVELS